MDFRYAGEAVIIGKRRNMPPSSSLPSFDPACLASLRAACRPKPKSAGALVTASLAVVGLATGVLLALVGVALTG